MNIETKMFNFALWLVCLSVLMAILTSCSPYQGLQIGTPTPRAQPIATAKPSTILNKSQPTPSPITCKVNAAKVYMRKGAGMSHAVIEVLHTGQILTVIDRGVWLMVTTRKHAGFIYSKYCK
jgi:hypothetical protein